MTEIKTKIEQLYALAKDQQGLPEGEAAALVAKKLQQQYAISDSELNLSQSSDIPILVEDWDIATKTNWRRILLSDVCNYLSCRMLYYKGTSMVRLFGEPRDVALVKWLYDTLESQLNQSATDYYKDKLSYLTKLGFISRGEAMKRRTDFLMSALYTLEQRMTKTEEKELEPSCQELMVSRKKQVDSFFEENAGEFALGEVAVRSFIPEGLKAGETVTISRGGLTS